MKRLRLLAITLTVIGSTLAFLPAKAEPKVHVVYVGKHFKGDESAPYTYTRYLPGTLKVHRGDIVEWRFFGGFNAWHSIAFNLGAEEADPMVFDEMPEHFRYSDTLVFGTQPPQGNGHVSTATHKACGRHGYIVEADMDPCELSSPRQVLASALWDQFFASAVPPRLPDGSNTAFRVKIAGHAELGDYIYKCVAHVGMHGTLRVVDDSEALDPPMTEAEADAEVEKDYRGAQDAEKLLTEQAYSSKTREWTVWAGYSTGNIAITGFVPSHLDIRRGETVNFKAGTSEPNSVSFPGESGGSFAGCVGAKCHGTVGGRAVPYGVGPFSQDWGCDIDGNGPAPAAMFSYVIPRLRTNAPQLEAGCPLMARREVYMGPVAKDPTRSPGNLVTHGVFHNSGMMFAENTPDSLRLRPDGGYFLSNFEAKFLAPSPDPIRFVCYAHPDQMKGSIRVQ